MNLLRHKDWGDSDEATVLSGGCTHTRSLRWLSKAWLELKFVTGRYFAVTTRYIIQATSSSSYLDWLTAIKKERLRGLGSISHCLHVGLQEGGAKSEVTRFVKRLKYSIWLVIMVQNQYEILEMTNKIQELDFRRVRGHRLFKVYRGLCERFLCEIVEI